MNTILALQNLDLKPDELMGWSTVSNHCSSGSQGCQTQPELEMN
ncbi:MULTISPECIES: class III lanthipeptide [Stenotrophomonas]|nr:MULTISPECIES: class III lanthipeptide [Stenotrophomonas]MDA3308115.1 class III lanthipeptide [Stenotrophomonas sp. PI_27]WGS57358.1 class III lanthipeptide [Stenotrophomonas pavanii]